MKRTLCAVLMVLFVMSMLSLTGCNNTGTPSSDGAPGPANTTASTFPKAHGLPNPVTWQKALSLSNFNNVTFSHHSIFLSGYEADQDVYTDTYKIDGDLIIENDGPVIEDGSTLSSIQEYFLGVVFGMLENPNDFFYNQTDKCYKNKQDITYAMDIVVGMRDYHASITARDVIVTFDDAGNLSQVSCQMEQNITFEERSFCYLLSTTFHFYDYGTTVVSQ